MTATGATTLAAILAIYSAATPVKGAQAQTAPDALPTFEVASIKPAQPGAAGSSTMIDRSGRFTAENSTLKGLILFAYDVRPFQVSGGPSWLERDTYDVLAQPENRAAAGPVMRQMVQALLADRFQLKAHRETREAPVYKLVLAKSGPKLHEAPNPLHGIAGRPDSIESKGSDMKALAQTLARRLGRPVVDETGLTGFYDFTLTYDPAQSAPTSITGEARPLAENAGPSLFTALQEQLGLKLEAARGPVEMLVIDRAEKPAGN